MRPRGEIRQALASAAEQLHEQQGGATWRELGAAACVGFAVAKQYAKDMANAGELEIVGTRHVPGSCRPMRVYAPRRRSWVMNGATLGDVLSGWVKR
jgi:hypothetical protein